MKRSLFALAALLAFTTLRAQTADDIISKYVTAVGGKDAITGVKSLIIESSVSVMGNDIPSTTTIVVGKGYKNESDFQGTKMVQCFSDKGGWMLNPMAGAATPTALTDEQAKAGKLRSDRKIEKSEAEWRAQLTPEQYHIVREKGTERPFTGALYQNHDDGMYHCVACGAKLFPSDTKFESGSGWPSFYLPVDNTAVETHEDNSLGCGGLRRLVRGAARTWACFSGWAEAYGVAVCINSASLDFEKAK